MSQATMTVKKVWAYTLEEVEQLSEKYGNKLIAISVLIILTSIGGIDIKGGFNFPTTDLRINEESVRLVLYGYFIWLVVKSLMISSIKMNEFIYQEVMRSDKSYVVTGKNKILEEMKSLGINNAGLSEWNKSNKNFEAQINGSYDSSLIKELANKGLIDIGSSHVRKNEEAQGRSFHFYYICKKSNAFQRMRRKLIIDNYLKDVSVFDRVTPWLFATAAIISIVVDSLLA